MGKIIYQSFNQYKTNKISSLQKKLKPTLLIICTLCFCTVKAQKIDSIFVNLYTDSLKKGTYNYINVDGLLSNGRYLPLDTTHLTFTASAGEFKGNSLWLSKDFKDRKVSFKVVLKANPAQHKEFDIYIKQKPDDDKLKTNEEIMNDIKRSRKSKKYLIG